MRTLNYQKLGFLHFREIYAIAYFMEVFYDCGKNVILVYNIMLDKWDQKTSEEPCNLQGRPFQPVRKQGRGANTRIAFL